MGVVQVGGTGVADGAVEAAGETAPALDQRPFVLLWIVYVSTLHTLSRNPPATYISRRRALSRQSRVVQ
jgi:hypothetical protein